MMVFWALDGYLDKWIAEVKKAERRDSGFSSQPRCCARETVCDLVVEIYAGGR
jgi:hypothetical protein